MNKKIKQFSEQAIHDDNGETLHFLPHPRYIEKFSALIIQECIDTIMNNTDRHRKEYFANLLKEHFGVE